MKRWRVREVWKVEGWSYVYARTLEEAEKLLGDGDGEFHDPGAQEWVFHETKGNVEEAP